MIDEYKLMIDNMNDAPADQGDRRASVERIEKLIVVIGDKQQRGHDRQSRAESATATATRPS